MGFFNEVVLSANVNVFIAAFGLLEPMIINYINLCLRDTDLGNLSRGNAT